MTELEQAPAAAGTGESPQLLIPGQVIQNYEIQKPLGKGKFSVVYMAKRLSDELMCALKKINIFDMMVPKQREKCMKEVRLLQSLDHPNIVKLLDSFVDSSELLIIVEWAEKGDLKRLIRKATQNSVMFKMFEIWEYARQLSSALDHMHKKRIMHRDLKPANIFVAQDNSLKLGDLGLGRLLSSHTLEAFSKVGTPLYMSPEVLKGAGYDMKSDVWSLGCVLYELCVLRSPFKSDQQLSLYDLFVRINKGQYPPLPDMISTDFRELTYSMLQLEPATRADSSQVLDVCIEHVKVAHASAPGSAAAGQQSDTGPTSQARARPSPLLVMDDIVEKLKLLECDEQCFRKKGFPMLHRCFFAEPLPVAQQSTISQFEVMHELLQWLLTMLKERDAKAAVAASAPESFVAAAADVSAGPCLQRQPSEGRVEARPAAITKSFSSSSVGAGDAAAGGLRRQRSIPERAPPSKADTQELVKGLLPQLAQRGLQISSEATLTQLQQGYGEGVCLVLNELINQELVARNFHFAAPCWMDEQEQDDCEDIEEDIADGGEAQAEGEHDSEESVEPEAENVQYGGAISSTGAPSIEPIHVADVDAQAWAEEVSRVAPSLKGWKRPGAESDWRHGITMVQEIHKSVLQEGLLTQTPLALEAYSTRLQEELGILGSKEERMNHSTAAREHLKSMQATREQVSESMESIAALQAHVSELSQRDATLEKELEEMKAKTHEHSEAVQESDAVPHLRKACRRLQRESTALAVKLRFVEIEIACRQKHNGLNTQGVQS
mmetsp:Transcript_11598/g.27036  ORF Transcript_11598/g.27036 Transcript_11598/m.27036 type:complete len:778 (-) Transcript_11598:102-2435(-)|eukprot:CAMPEP_0178389126 /NCGR_PEP_ID=MMETSP0689_2-20121128/9950_1 /TAXON_ID=160604 /ORGANISM="Amphidinium massartii, Strain CS-259" /LENGTH=777 /DNA_ID=CAMNT_0020009555 /DNA_START=128 /DNA_END=2461 /DNA_ORIENTATION=-